MKSTVVCLVLFFSYTTFGMAKPVIYTTNNAASSSAFQNLVASNVFNGAGSIWSSGLHPAKQNTEWLAYWWQEGLQDVNFIKILPRYYNSKALCFPVTFTIYYSNGPGWVEVASYTSYPTPLRGDWIILPLPGTFVANGIQIVATTLSDDGVGNFAFQLASAQAGYDSNFNKFSWLGNNAAALPAASQIGGVQPNAFNPNRLSHWDYDDRGVVLQPNPGTYRNIYAPQAVYQGGFNWNVYFGGWDGTPTGNDQVYMTTTGDNFGSFGSHRTIISHGSFNHINNESVIQVGPHDWRMVYTANPSSNINKPGYATSTDGINWTPNTSNTAYFLNLNGTINGTPIKNLDINGGNTIFLDPSGLWHLFFVADNYHSVLGAFHATSYDGVNFTYQNQTETGVYSPQDVKAFWYGGQTYYYSIFTNNGQGVYSTVSTQLAQPGNPNVQFRNQNTADEYIVAAGTVQDGTRIYGILYGASPTNALDTNRIFASWLQKKVIFQNNYVRWGDVETGYGPTNVRVYMGSPNEVETGNFYVYDTDGTTLLFESPTVTMRAGDIWNYTGN